MDSNINPSLLQMVRNDLIQLHCENVSWEKATDKILAEVASYLLGDLVQYLSTVVFLRGNRCLFTLEWPQVRDASEVWNYLVEYSMGRMEEMEVAQYKCQYMLTHVGPLYDDLVEIYCHAHWGQPGPNYRKEDVWETGRLQPQEHPEILYLPPSLIGSTPKKASTQSRGNPPKIEDMEHHELVELIKKLMEERNSKPPIPTPIKDTTVAGHVSMNQESFVQSSQAILQGLAEGGYINTKSPKFECFFGDEKKKKLDFDVWERQILSTATTHLGAAIKQAVI